MSDDENGPAGRQHRQVLLDNPLASIVERARRFVEISSSIDMSIGVINTINSYWLCLDQHPRDDLGCLERYWGFY